MSHKVPFSKETKAVKRNTTSWVIFTSALVLLVLGTWYFLRGGDSGSTESPPEAPSLSPGSSQVQAPARAEQRLRSLRGAHEQTGSVAREAVPGAVAANGASEGGKFRVPTVASSSGLAARLRPRAGASVPSAEVEEAPEADYEEPDPDDIPALKRMALEDPDPDRRLAAVTLLGASDDPQVIPILAEVLKDQDEEVRLAAIQSLADMTGEVPIEVLGNAALNDPSPDNRYEALEALADVGGVAARSYIEKALQDPDEDVSSLAESLLELEHDTAPTSDQHESFGAMSGNR